MKILHLNAGNETGGGMHHILRVLGRLSEHYPRHCYLGLMERKELYERAVSQNIDTVHFHANFLLMPQKLHRIRAFIKEHQITHVHTHGPRANVYMSWLRNMIQTKWITTIHSDPLEDFKERGVYGKLLTSMHLRSIKYASKIITVSRTFQPLLKEAGCSDEKIKVIRNGIDFTGVDQTRDVSRRELGLDEADFLMVQVARFHPVKAHYVAFEAMKKIIEQHPIVHLLLIGDGPMREQLQDLAVQLGIENHIHFIGETNSVDSYYKLADVTLLTSLSESFPYVLLESARMQTPVITTETGDVDVLLDSADKGWKVPVNDPDSIAGAVFSAVQQQSVGNLTKIGRNLQKQAKSRFSLDKCVQEVYNVYSEL